MGIGGGTVAALFRHAGIPAACWARLDEIAHQPNEYCIIDNMVGDAKVFGHIFPAGIGLRPDGARRPAPRAAADRSSAPAGRCAPC